MLFTAGLLLAQTVVQPAMAQMTISGTVRLSKILIRVLSIRSDAISNFSMKVILMQMPMTILFVAKQEFMPEEDRNRVSVVC